MKPGSVHRCVIAALRLVREGKALWMTRVLEEIGVPREAVTIIIYEAEKTNWASGGQLHSEKYENR